MKRDMDLVRKILLECEAAEDTRQPIAIRIDGYADHEISYHVQLMGEAGLLDVVNFSNSRSGSVYEAKRLTWEGHEFLDAARNDTTWNKAKGAVSSVAGVGFEVIKGVLVSYGTEQAKKMLGQ